jgi:hypothetical protein
MTRPTTATLVPHFCAIFLGYVIGRRFATDWLSGTIQKKSGVRVRFANKGETQCYGKNLLSNVRTLPSTS